MKCWHEAPFDDDGHMMTYEGWRCEMRPVKPFNAEMSFVRFDRGRSSAIAIFIDSTGREWPMFLTDLSDAMLEIKNGNVSGEFVFCKRGKNYGIKLARAA